MCSAGKELPLCKEHAAICHYQKNCPAPDTCPEQVLADQATSNEAEKDINQVQETHGLKGSEPYKRSRPQHNKRHNLLEDAIDKDCQRKACQLGCATFGRNPPEQPEEKKRSQRAQPLIP